MRRVKSIKEVNDFLVWSKKQLGPAMQEATREHFSEEFKERFSFGNTLKYGYKPNKPSTEAQKVKKWGIKPQLVASGHLRNQVSQFKVNTRGMVVKYPRYGHYLINDGRNFLQFRKLDLIQLKSLSKTIFRKWL